MKAKKREICCCHHHNINECLGCAEKVPEHHFKNGRCKNNE